MSRLTGTLVCITGASSGIGSACAEAFAREGCRLLLSARRIERVDALAETLRRTHGVDVHTHRLDVRNQGEVENTVRALPASWQEIDILVNNAGLARGFTSVQEGSLTDWEEMIDTNIKGLLYVTRAVLPGMVRRKRGHVINIGSIAGHQVYPNGNVYCATKFAVGALTQGLKMDLLGTGVRVASVSPGMVETEFSLVRFHGNSERAAQTYARTRPLSAEDVAETVLFVASRPPHVDISEVLIMPTDQASVYHLHRSEQ
jgi:3-hydroxy acid dehydrogenase/malonic semialdehyde reductase